MTNSHHRTNNDNFCSKLPTIRSLSSLLLVSLSPMKDTHWIPLMSALPSTLPWPTNRTQKYLATLIRSTSTLTSLTLHLFLLLSPTDWLTHSQVTGDAPDVNASLTPCHMTLTTSRRVDDLNCWRSPPFHSRYLWAGVLPFHASLVATMIYQYFKAIATDLFCLMPMI